jgi:Domain of unknown function (DUF4190)
MDWREPGAAGHGYPVASAELGQMRAADADRDRAAGALGTAYVTDLPAEQAAPVSPVARTSGLAVACLAFGLAQFIVGPLATIPAIVLGYAARSRIRRTGEQGAGLALAGLTLGWMAVILGIVLIVAGLAISGGTHGDMPMPMH